jgi:hypothetical protein
VGLPDAVQQQVREAACQAVLDYRAGKLVPGVPDGQTLARMLRVGLAEDIPPSYGRCSPRSWGAMAAVCRCCPPGSRTAAFGS